MDRNGKPPLGALLSFEAAKESQANGNPLYLAPISGSIKKAISPITLTCMGQLQFNEVKWCLTGQNYLMVPFVDKEAFIFDNYWYAVVYVNTVRAQQC